MSDFLKGFQALNSPEGYQGAADLRKTFDPGQKRDEKGRWSEENAARVTSHKENPGPIKGPNLIWGQDPAAYVDMISEFQRKTGGVDPKDIDPRSLYDCDLWVVAKHGHLYVVENAIAMPGRDNECHWNVEKLHTAKKIDEIATGYSNPLGTPFWVQHSWGLKNGVLVETTPANIGNEKYFGITLNPKETKAFVKWCRGTEPDKPAFLRSKKKLEW